MIYGTAVMFIYYVFWLFSTLYGKYPGCSLGRARSARNKCRFETWRKLSTILTILNKGSNSFLYVREIDNVSEDSVVEWINLPIWWTHHVAALTIDFSIQNTSIELSHFKAALHCGSLKTNRAEYSDPFQD